MPRKATASTEGATDGGEPRRSSRIKEQPKPEPVVVKKAPAKPRSKKAEKDTTKETKADSEEKPKSTKGKKRKADEDAPAEGAEGDDKAPPAKKVRHLSTFDPSSRLFYRIELSSSLLETF